MTRLLKQFPLFLLLLPLFVVVHIERDLPGLIDYALLYDQLFFLFLAPLLFFFICYVFSRSMKKAALQTFAILIFFYFFGEIKNSIGKTTSIYFLQSYSFLVPLFALPLFFILYKISKSRSPFNRHFFILNIGLLLFIIADIFILFINAKKNDDSIAKLEADYTPCDSCAKPDIYYIILDSYASTSMMEQDFNFSNEAMENSLKQKGFHIIPASRSNYNMTIFSVASVFNLDYLPELDTTRTLYLRDLLPATKRIYDNSLITLLKKENYQVFNHSIFNMRNHPATTPVFDIWDLRGLYRQYNFFFKAFSEMSYHLPTRLRYFFNDDEVVVLGRERDRLDSAIMQNIVTTSALATDGPKFVYAHFSKPHAPYTFDSTGQSLPPYPVWPPHIQWKNHYIQQIVYMNNAIEKIVDTILANAKRETVIIIQGDHGFRFFDEQYNAKEFPNFNAVYFSNREYSLFNDSTTNVNTFRIVCNTFLKKKYPLLENRTYFLRFKLM